MEKPKEKVIYIPNWMKAVLGFALIMLGLLFTFLLFRFFPVLKETGYDQRGALEYSLFALGVVFVMYLVGLIMDKKHPYTLFFICLAIFAMLLVGIRVLYL